MILTFDGESGSGKSTLARKTARKLGYTYVAAGLLFRAYAFLGDPNEINYEWNEKEVVKYKGMDVTEVLKSEEVGKLASEKASNGETYEKMNEFVRGVIKSLNAENIVVEGRSVGKSLYPNADYKFFVTADSKVRAQRRFVEVGGNYKEVEKQVTERDERDRNRASFPLNQEDDCIVIDNSHGSVEEKVQEILAVINQTQ